MRANALWNEESVKRYGNDMVKTLLKSVREYKKPTFITLFFIILEVVIEVFIPMMTANLINTIQEGNAELSLLVRQGLILTALAVVSLCCGGIAGAACSKAS
jgi:ATP-binding cassette subfamily B protein